MAKLIALYKTPSDKQAFDAHYTSTHAPLAKKMPGLRRFEVSTGPIAVAEGESPYYFLAVLDFDSLDAIKSALESPEGQATAGDLSNFAQAGVELLMFDTKEA